MQTFDFNRSYFRFCIDQQAQTPITLSHDMPTTVLSVRINIESRCVVTHRPTGKSRTYVLGASCKTERVGAARDCWLEPNADFCLIASEQEFLILKSFATNDVRVMSHPASQGVQPQRQSGACREAWCDFATQLRPARGQDLGSIEAIVAAIRGDRPICAQTQYDDGDYHVAIDYPIKTINYSERERVYQVDTGPIPLPDLSTQRLNAVERQVDCFDLAFVAFNSPAWAEAIVNVPTPAGNGVSVNHYSRTRRIEPARNALVEVVEGAAPPHPHISHTRHVQTDGAAERLVP
ncbi:MAG: hypothetical protein HYX69_12610 [Planctomycetia bacterium]|nr:hypothetical protein [Planctomycetia bacterium]